MMKMPKKIWDEIEIDYLKNNYLNIEIEILIRHLGKTKQQIQSKARLLGLNINKSLNENNHLFINNIEYKFCKTCNEYIVLNNFYKHKETFDGLSTSCKECVKKRSKKHIEMHKNEVKEYQKEYRINNREKLNDYSNKYYYKNHDKLLKVGKKYRLKYNENIKVYRKLYLQTEIGKEVNRLKEQKRRSRKKNLKSDLTIGQWNETIKNWTDSNGYIHCAYCSEITVKPEQEHIIPLSKNGEYTKNNIIPICKTCNTSKNNKSLEEFYIINDKFSIDNLNKVKLFVNKYSFGNGGVLL